MAATIDRRLRAALTRQLTVWQATLDAGAERVGWKLGVGDRERIAGELAIGHLTSATQLEPGATYRSSTGAALHADAEVAVRLGSDVADADAAAARAAIAAYAGALELVDLAHPPDDPESVVAENVFHRAVCFGRWQAAPAADVRAALLVDGEVRAAARAAADYGAKVAAVARLLGAVGEQLRAGDVVITGNVVQVAIAPGEHVAADFGPLGRAELVIA